VTGSYPGWNQAAFAHELAGTVTPCAIGDRSLVLVRRDDGDIKAFDATCPHRGAHLGHGGVLEGDALVCPFHGHRIGLSCPGPNGYVARGYPTVAAGGAIFVLLDDRFEHGFGTWIDAIKDTHVLVPGFVLDTRVAPEYVIENVFDAAHFQSVHHAFEMPRLAIDALQTGALTVATTVGLRSANPWDENGAGGSRFFARIFSPTLVATELGPAGRAHVVITAATPSSGGGARIRVTIAARPPAQEVLPDREVVRSLLEHSRLAFEQDMAIWEHLDTRVAPCYTPADEPVVRYREYCRQFA
jgi:nitrite reductase/ring-hydroxylating ferredoxin subunit